MLTYLLTLPFYLGLLIKFEFTFADHVSTSEIQRGSWGRLLLLFHLE